MHFFTPRIKGNFNLGGYSEQGNMDSVLEFIPETRDWKLVGRVEQVTIFSVLSILPQSRDA